MEKSVIEKTFFYKCIAAYLKIYNAYTPKSALRLTLISMGCLHHGGISYAFDVAINHARFNLGLDPIMRIRMDATFFNKIILRIVNTFAKKDLARMDSLKADDGTPFITLMEREIKSNRTRVVSVSRLGHNVFGLFSPNYNGDKVAILGDLILYTDRAFKTYFSPNKSGMFDVGKMLYRYIDK